jgi:flavin-binding protein dodecin
MRHFRGGTGKGFMREWRQRRKEQAMHEDHVYKKIELVGSSTTSIGDAIEKAIERAAKTIKHLEWFEVDQVRGHIEDGKIAHYQVVLKVGFRLQE